MNKPTVNPPSVKANTDIAASHKLLGGRIPLEVQRECRYGRPRNTASFFIYKFTFAFASEDTKVGHFKFSLQQIQSIRE